MTTLADITTDKMYTMSYLVYKRMYDYENGTQYMQQHKDMIGIGKSKYNCHAHPIVKDVTPAVVPATRIDTNNGLQRNIVGDYNDNRVMIKKTLNHLNAMKRAFAIAQQTLSEHTRLQNENIMLRELLYLELAIRTINKNISEQE